MSERAIRHVENNAVADFRPIGIGWEKYKLCVGIDKVPDQPWAGDTINFDFLAGDPFDADVTFLRVKG